MVALLSLSSGCRRPVDVSPATLVRMAPMGDGVETDAQWRGRVAVTRADGRSFTLSRDFDALVIPRRGPSRLFLRPVRARIEAGQLHVRGSNRRAARIRVENVASVVIYR